MTNVTRVGDSCVPGPSGGYSTNALTGSPTVNANSLPVHRVGDSWILPNPNHKTSTGSPSVYANQTQVARVFDQTNTGSIINVGSPTVYANESFITVSGVTMPSNQNSFKNAEPLIDNVGYSGVDDEFEVNGNAPVYPPLPQTSPPTPIPVSVPVAVEDDTPEPEPASTPVSDCHMITLPIDYDFQLSTNFKLRDLSINALFPHTIKAQNGLTEAQIVCNLKALAENILEPFKAQFGSFRINSGFRTRQNGISQHEKGQAVDIQLPGKTYDQLFAIAQWVKSNMNYDQLLWEHGNAPWVHISFNQAGNRPKNASNSVMTMYQNHYSPGLKKITNYS